MHSERLMFTRSFAGGVAEYLRMSSIYITVQFMVLIVRVMIPICLALLLFTGFPVPALLAGGVYCFCVSLTF